MKLFWSTRSPFVRKVMVVAYETGLADRIERERTIVAPAKPNPEVMAHNPINKLPTLVLDDGSALYDSRVIAEYFDSLHDGPRLFPPAGKPVSRPCACRRWRRRLDFPLSRSPSATGQRRSNRQNSRRLAVKFTTAFDRSKRRQPPALDGNFGIGQIAVACVLGYRLPLRREVA
ncbi:MAG: glutathione S-transferase N-terminal domain-containing protein [Hyphomicrobiaceae bacterium]